MSLGINEWEFKPDRTAERALLHPEDDEFLDRHSGALLAKVNSLLKAHPPGSANQDAREAALFLLDGVLHESCAPAREPVIRFFHEQVESAVESLIGATVSQGLGIWKIYNHGFVVRSRSVTVGFDLARGAYIPGFGINTSTMGRIVDECDILFISHWHEDHTDPWVVGRFLDQGKKVVAPPEAMQGHPSHHRLTHLPRVAHELQNIALREEGPKLDVVIYPGHQGVDVENNVTLVVTPENLCFVHTGDQYNQDDFVWIDGVGKHFQVDILLPNCWTLDLGRVVRGVSPKTVITGHENEMAHSISHREPYWLNKVHKQGTNDKLGYDQVLVAMAWGENYHYTMV